MIQIGLIIMFIALLILIFVNVVLWSIIAIQEKDIAYGLFALMFLCLFILGLGLIIC